MTLPSVSDLYEAVDATWPAAACSRVGPWMIRDGLGGGKRVSAATLEGDFSGSDIAVGEVAMSALGQTPLFMVRQGEGDLDHALKHKGYSIVDPVSLYACPTGDMATENLGANKGTTQWPPSDVAKAIWVEGGIGSGRLGVMTRAKGAKSVILAHRIGETVGVGFIATAAKIAMIHAIEVSKTFRRLGVGASILDMAADWAKNEGCDYLSLAVTDANRPANALYSKLGMSRIGGYHYRTK